MYNKANMANKKKTVKKIAKSHKTQKRQHPKHFLKVYWPYLPVIMVVIAGMLFGGVRPSSRVNQPATLAYSTEMSISALLSATNAQRASNGLGPLTLNSKLDSSAQAKANDMVSRDYWSHNTPDGQEPWIFFDSAGYSYQKAGENLAYGFSTSDATVVGWMNSPSHRANILDTSYTEVGFGFANSTNFVGSGEETIVVAHYGLPLGSTTPAPTAPTQSTPAPAPEPKTLNANNQQSQPVNETETAPEAQAEETPEEKPDEQPITTESPVPDETNSTNITRIQSITGGNAPWSALAISILGFSVVTLWIFKHVVLVKKFLLRGEQFVAHHPLIDLGVVVIVALAVYLSQSSGVVK